MADENKSSQEVTTSDTVEADVVPTRKTAPSNEPATKKLPAPQGKNMKGKGGSHVAIGGGLSIPAEE